MLLKLLPWFFLGLLFVWGFWLTYKYFIRTPPEEGSKEWYRNLYNDDDEFL